MLVDDGERAQHLGLSGDFDLLLLDMGLPQREGLEVLRELRLQGSHLPVLVLTGRSERDVVMCLEAGADDYMTKPFEFSELLARVRTRLRAAGTKEDYVLSAGDIRLDVRTRRAQVGERSVDLTAREFAVLETLMREPGTVVSRAKLEDSVYGWGEEVGSNSIEVHLHHLRRKLSPELIRNVRGVGYRVARID